MVTIETHPSSTQFQKDVHVVHILKETVKFNYMLMGNTAMNTDLLSHLKYIKQKIHTSLQWLYQPLPQK